MNNIATEKNARILEISFTETLSANISYWDDGITWQLNSRTQEQVLTLFSPPLAPFEVLSQREDCSDWYLAIPEPVRICIIKYRHIDFAILYMTSHYRYAYELFTSHPALFWLVMCEAKKNKWSEDKLVNVIGLPRKNIMGECGLPATQAAVKLLSKFNFERYDITALALIKSVLNLESYKKINHHHTINLMLAKLMVRHPVLVRPTFIHELKDDEWNSHLSNTLSDVFRLAEQLEMRNVIEDIAGCASNRELIELHDHLTRLLNQRLAKHAYLKKYNVDYPEPPIVGNDNIIPIVNGEELLQEGVDQKNCVASYHDDISTGHYFVYKVLSPERATLGLKLVSGQKPMLEQLYLKRNEEVSDKTRRAIIIWLKLSCPRTVKVVETMG